jgi:hypothetical protein
MAILENVKGGAIEEGKTTPSDELATLVSDPKNPAYPNYLEAAKKIEENEWLKGMNQPYKEHLTQTLAAESYTKNLDLSRMELGTRYDEQSQQAVPTIKMPNNTDGRVVELDVVSSAQTPPIVNANKVDNAESRNHTEQNPADTNINRPLDRGGNNAATNQSSSTYDDQPSNNPNTVSNQTGGATTAAGPMLVNNPDNPAYSLYTQALELLKKDEFKDIPKDKLDNTAQYIAAIAYQSEMKDIKDLSVIDKPGYGKQFVAMDADRDSPKTPNFVTVGYEAAQRQLPEHSAHVVDNITDYVESRKKLETNINSDMKPGQQDNLNLQQDEPKLRR